MNFKDRSTSELELDFNKPVDQVVLLNIITKLSVFALHSVDKQVRLERIEQTINLMTGLRNFEKGNIRQELNASQLLIYKEGEICVSKYNSSILLDFAKAFKLALNILDSKGMKHSDDWKTALKIKLKETRTMLEGKAKSIKQKLTTNSVKQGSVFFDEQQKGIKRSSSSDSAFTIGFNGEK